MTGRVLESGREVGGLKLEGFWDSHLDAVTPSGPPTRLWTKHAFPPDMNQ